VPVTETTTETKVAPARRLPSLETGSFACRTSFAAASGRHPRTRAAAKSVLPTCYDEILRIGIHTSSQGTLEKTALKAHELGANTFQIFSASPRMWRASPPNPADVTLLARQRLRLDLKPLVIHDNYLINLASIDPTIRSKSILCFRGELERAAAIGAEYLVAHPGSYKGQTLEEGIINFVHGLVEAAQDLALGSLALGNLTLLIECTAGGGCHIGSRFEELRSIRDMAAGLTGLPIGFCLDTCHLLAAGYDIGSETGLDETLRDADRILGMKNVKLIHANDSKTPLGSRVDRHENIGQGHIGKDGFRRILAHPKLKRLPFILETPVDQEGDDVRNLETLKKLCPKSTTITTKSN
jgi:deoxyribonuclease IV